MTGSWAQAQRPRAAPRSQGPGDTGAAPQSPQSLRSLPTPEGWSFLANAQWDSAPAYSLAPQLCAGRRLCRQHCGHPACSWERNQVGRGRQRGGRLHPPWVLLSHRLPGEGPWGQRASRLGRGLQPLTPPAAALRDPEAWAERAAGDTGTCGASPRSAGGSCLPLQRLPTHSGSRTLTSLASINCSPAWFWLHSGFSQ